jgi:hypothetical protein
MVDGRLARGADPNPCAAVGPQPYFRSAGRPGRIKAGSGRGMRKLRLNRETLRELSPERIREAGGGVITGTETISCNLSCRVCAPTHTCISCIPVRCF